MKEHITRNSFIDAQDLVVQFAAASAKQGEFLRKALAEIEKMDDMLFMTIGKAVQDVPAPMQTAWAHVLDAGKAAGTGTCTGTGNMASATIAQLTEQSRAELRVGRATGSTVAQTLLDSYSALVSGVLLGLSEGLQGKGPAAAATEPRTARSRKA